MQTRFRGWCALRSFLLSASVAIFSGTILVVPQVFATDCSVAALSALGVAHVTITSATDVPAAEPNPKYCDVKGSLATDGDGAGPNSAAFEAMLPVNWNQKFIFNGVGGLAGTLNSSANAVDKALFLARGYATAITNTGHVNTDPTWEFTSPGEPNMAKIVDYYYRAVHQVTIATKALVKGYYSAPSIAHSYFDGCSNGGKMGVMEAMRFPEDYDGIISGSPWLDPLGTSLWDLRNSKLLADAYIPPSLYPAIDAAIQKQCDSADGVGDGLIQNPAKCAFDPNTLVPNTLTQQQADALKAMLKPVATDSGKLVYPGTSVSNLGEFGGTINEAETAPADPRSAQPWGTATPPQNWTLARNVLANFGFHDPATDMNNAVESVDAVKSDTYKMLYDRLAGDIPGQASKFAAFMQKGGKLLIYHGYDDLVISPYSSIWFYEDLAEKNGGYEKVQEHVRLFMAPGMLHCFGGPGPNSFDTLSAMEKWVERDEGPDGIIASHSTGNAVDRTMPLCKFPEQAKYKGSGDVKDAANWTCPANDRSLLDVGPNGKQAGLRAAGH